MQHKKAPTRYFKRLANWQLYSIIMLWAIAYAIFSAGDFTLFGMLLPAVSAVSICALFEFAAQAYIWYKDGHLVAAGLALIASPVSSLLIYMVGMWLHHFGAGTLSVVL